MLERCLDRDPKQRLRDIGEARVELARVLSGTPDLAILNQALKPSLLLLCSRAVLTIQMLHVFGGKACAAGVRRPVGRATDRMAMTCTAKSDRMLCAADVGAGGTIAGGGAMQQSIAATFKRRR